MSHADRSPQEFTEPHRLSSRHRSTSILAGLMLAPIGIGHAVTTRDLEGLLPFGYQGERLGSCAADWPLTNLCVAKRQRRTSNRNSHNRVF